MESNRSNTLSRPHFLWALLPTHPCSSCQVNTPFSASFYLRLSQICPLLAPPSLTCLTPDPHPDSPSPVMIQPFLNSALYTNNMF